MKHMKNYCENITNCRRRLLFDNFVDCQSSDFKGCLCCDVCQIKCKCGQCAVNLESFCYSSVTIICITYYIINLIKMLLGTITGFNDNNRIAVT